MYRDHTYKKNGYNVIFVHAYKHQKEWKKYLVKRIIEVDEQRHDEVNFVNKVVQNSLLVYVANL